MAICLNFAVRARRGVETPAHNHNRHQMASSDHMLKIVTVLSADAPSSVGKPATMQHLQCFNQAGPPVIRSTKLKVLTGQDAIRECLDIGTLLSNCPWNGHLTTARGQLVICWLGGSRHMGMPKIGQSRSDRQELVVRIGQIHRHP